MKTDCLARPERSQVLFKTGTSVIELSEHAEMARKHFSVSSPVK